MQAQSGFAQQSVGVYQCVIHDLALNAKAAISVFAIHIVLHEATIRPHDDDRQFCICLLPRCFYCAAAGRGSARFSAADHAAAGAGELLSAAASDLANRFLNLINTSPLSLRSRMLNVQTPV